MVETDRICSVCAKLIDWDACRSRKRVVRHGTIHRRLHQSGKKKDRQIHGITVRFSLWFLHDMLIMDYLHEWEYEYYIHICSC